nr:lanthionine synthetase LanC family protein [uncultured Dyadobacter sp.]
MFRTASPVPYDAAASSIEKIYHLISRHQDTVRAPGLLTGHLGTALFYYLYALHSRQHQCLSLAKNQFEKALHILGSQPGSIETGFNDLSLLANYLSTAGVIRPGLGKPFPALDRLLLQKMRAAFQSGQIGGFACGALGYGLHFLNRAFIYPKYYLHVVGEIIQRLQSAAIYGPSACHWCYDQHYTTTLWNGQAAVILFLTRTAELELVKKESVSGVLFKAIEFLLSQHKHQVSTDLLSVQMGDLGTGYALLRAGQTFGNDSWQNAGLQILGARAGKTLTLAGADLPLGILNGAAGAAIVFKKIHALTANPLFDHAAQRSYKALLSMEIPSEADQKIPFSQTELSFGTGISGIGATMIQMLHPQKINLQPLLWLL